MSGFIYSALGDDTYADQGCVCRLGPDCPRPGQCDDSAVAAAADTEQAYADARAHQVHWMTARERFGHVVSPSVAELRERAAVELAAEFGTDISEWTV